MLSIVFTCGDYTEKAVVEKLFTPSPKLKLAYQFSRILTGIFDSHITPELAKEKMTEWIYEVTKSGLSCFNKFTKTLTNYQAQIYHYFIQRNTSGFVEGFNNKVKLPSNSAISPTWEFKRALSYPQLLLKRHMNIFRLGLGLRFNETQ